jgi:hypothetical protein
MAPEIIGQSKVGEQSDQYSLAASFAELRLNRPVFSSTSFYALMQDHLKTIPNLAPLGKREQQVLHRALAKDPQQRYGSCVEFMDELAKALAPEPPKPPRPSPSRRLLVTALLVLPLLVVLGSLAAYWYFLHSFSVHIVPQSVTLRAGETAPVTVEFRRRPAQPLYLRFPNQPDPITIAGTSGQVDTEGIISPLNTLDPISEQRESLELRVIAAPNASAGIYQVAVHAEAADHRQEYTITFQLTIQPRAYFLPDAWQRAAEGRPTSHSGKVYYDQIEVICGGTPVRFILIPRDPERRNAPETFYIMRDKVWVGLFRRFADANAGVLKDGRWKDVPSNNTNAQYPVMGVIADDAHQFARWLGGYLPLSSQWDEAAGRYRKDHGEGPFSSPLDGNAKPRVAVGRNEPNEIGLAADDKSLFGVRDMAGNGYELTRNLALDDNRRVPLTEPGAIDDFVRLRGCNFKADRPLMFKDLESKKEYRALPYLDASEDTGFRVVIEP